MKKVGKALVHRSGALALAWVLACSGDDGGSSAGSEASSTADGTAGSTASGGSSGTQTGSSGATATSVADTSTGGPPLSCDEAFDPATCDQAGGEYEDCGWFEVQTWALDANEACGEVEIDGGYCFLTERGDDGCGVLADPSCPDGVTVVYYNSVGLEIGAVELFIDAGEYLTCDGPGGPFMPCTFDGTTWSPPECACGCPP